MIGRRTRLTLIISIPSLLLVLLIVDVFVLPLILHPTTPGNLTATVTTASNALPTKDVSRLERALSSSDIHTQATVMTPDLASAYLTNGQLAYPIGSIVQVLQDTSICTNDVCEVKATMTVPGGKQSTFILYLSNSSGSWLIIDTAKES